MDFIEARETARLLGRPPEDLTEVDLHDYVDDGPSRLNRQELAWFLPRLCALIAEGRCPTPVGWPGALSALSRSGYPEGWPEARAEAVQGFVEALALDYVARPWRYAHGGHWGEGIEHLGVVISMAHAGGIDTDRLLARLSDAPERDLARALAMWSTGFEYRLQPHPTIDVLCWEIACDLTLDPALRDRVSSWLKALGVSAMVRRVWESEEDPEWRERLELAAVLWP